jgi:mono/diheme cytochrome c family protein
MHDQPRYEPLEASKFFDDGRASRPLVEGTVPRGSLTAEQPQSGPASAQIPVPGGPAGRAGQAPDRDFPFPVTFALLARGQERFNISCSPCHGRVGDGNGMIVQRGFRRPPSLHEQRLREATVSHFYDVITNGIGAMPSYADQVAPRDRWAIIAYLRALQLSQNATLHDVPPEERQKLGAGGQPAR